jgi:hypothetical protein
MMIGTTNTAGCGTGIHFPGWLLAMVLLALGSSVRADDYRHTLMPGDTLIGIAEQLLEHPHDWIKLQRLNKIADPYHMLPGSIITIPFALLRREPATARVSAVKGDVRSTGGAVSAGATLKQGDQLTTGEQSFATVELLDGSLLVLQPSSRLLMEKLVRLRNTTVPETRLRLDQGRVESTITKNPGGQPHYIINAPGATIGVRGTQFRVATAEEGEAVRAEVSEGTVVIGAGKRGSPTTALPAGFGLVLEDGRAGTPVPLLPAPDLSALPSLQERTIVRLVLPVISGARAYRIQIGADQDMREVLAENLNEKPEAKFGGLPDGQYTLRARGVDANGLEGKDADFAFKLKAHPEPPFVIAPAGGQKLRAESAELSWSIATEAARYRVQLAMDSQFASPVADIDGVEGTVILPAKKLEPGDYYWRIRSIRADGDTGPWGDAQRFVLKPLPANPEPPKIDDEHLNFAWSAEPGQVFLFQFARDDKFADVLNEQKVGQPSAVVARPGGGTYYMRVRATDPDGFVGPFTATQKIEVPAQPPWWLLLMLLPVL